MDVNEEQVPARKALWGSWSGAVRCIINCHSIVCQNKNGTFCSSCAYASYSVMFAPPHAAHPPNHCPQDTGLDLDWFPSSID